MFMLLNLIIIALKYASICTCFGILLFTLITFLTELNSGRGESVKKKAELRLKDPYESLPDIIHDNIPPINFYYPDNFIILLNIISVFKIYLLNNFYKNLLCLAICLIIRSFAIGLTILPSCIPKNRINKKLSFYDKCFLSSHDLMFSGHTICYFFFANILNLHIVKIIGPLLSVLSRQHYTIDVLVASLLYSYIYLLLPPINNVLINNYFLSLFL